MSAEANSGEGPVILERFRLLRQLGEGGMGTVYYAEHVHLGSKHAVKALKPMGGSNEDLQKQMEARFLREAKVCASVKHPNLVAVTDFGASDGTLYLVMDFIDGEDLQEVISREGGLSEEMSLRILRDVTAAVGALHAEGVIHRDLKPPNVMIEKATGRVVLTDLGIAKDLEAVGTQQMTQGILGTPAYMAPEQMVDTSKASFETDVYALGAMFYAMVACKDPFEGDNPLVVLQTAREQLFAYGSLGGVAEKRDKLQLSPQVMELLKEMSRYDRKKRMSSCDDVVARIDAILAAAGQGAWAGTGQLPAGALDSVQPGGAGDGDDQTLFGMDMLTVDPNAPPAPAGPAAPALTAPGTGAAGSGPEPGLTMGRKPPSSGADLGTAASLMQKPPTGGPAGVGGGPTPATLKEDEPQPAAGAGTGRGQKNVLAALSGAGGRAPRKSFVAVWVLLFLMAAAGGGGGFYYYQYVFLPSQTPGERIDDEGRNTTPAVVDDGANAGETVKPDETAKPDAKPDAKPEEGMEPVAKPPTAEPAFDEAKAPKRLKLPISRGLAVEFVIVPSGKFTIGSDRKGDSFVDARPRRLLELTKAFYIGRFEVTVAQFAAYLEDAKPRGVEEMALDKMGIEEDEGTYLPFPGNRKFPVRAVTHKHARAYCRWMSKKTGLKVDLPGEVQWEYAARGPESRVYPWGDEWDDALCNGGKKDDLVEVGSYPDGASWCGAEDMAGNVFEWCADRYDKARYRSLSRKDPAVLGKGSSSGLRVMRGGAYSHDSGICSSAYRFAMTGAVSDDILGFRVSVVATAAVAKYAAEE